MSLALSQSLKSLTTTKFQQAKLAKHITFSETKLTVIQSPKTGSIQFRFLPSLANKPAESATKSGSTDSKSAERRDNSSARKFDPFDNPSEDLLIAQVPGHNPTHNLVLNKFPVIPNHFILSTKENKPQVFPLETDDIYLTYQCILDWNTSHQTSGHLFAFFNSGSESGASQPHRHVQFLPIEDMAANSNKDWSILVNSMTQIYHTSLDLLHNPALPFVHYAMDISPSLSADELHMKYLHLLRASSASTVNQSSPLSNKDISNAPITRASDQSQDLCNGQVVGTGNETLKSEVIFDYNLCLTIDKMAILPRLHGDVQIPHADRDNGAISINGTILAGTLMTKSEEHWQSIQEKPELLDDLLLQIGYNKSSGSPGEQDEGKHRL